MMEETRIKIAQELHRQGCREKAEWWNRYLKGEIPFIGVGTPEIRKVFLERDRQYAFGKLPMNRQVSLVNGLMRGDFAEEKLAAILYVQLYWLDSQKPGFLMNLVSDWFDDRNIYDWNTTDWLSIRILAPLIDSGNPGVIWKMKRWNRDPCLWKARASLVPFARVSSITSHAKIIDRFADMLIRRKERYAKTAVGWVLREYSKHDRDFVLSFLSRHAKYVTAEVKRNALRYYREKPRQL